MAFSQWKIDWNNCITEEISSERDDLPPNICAFKADELTPDILRHAVNQCTAPVQVVQIETPYDSDLVTTAAELRRFESEDTFWQGKDLKGIDLKLQEHFFGIADSTSLAEERVQQLSRRLSVSPTSVISLYGQDALNEFMIFREEVNSIDRYCFHQHVLDDKLTPDGRRAFFLTDPLSSLSSVFVDSRQVCESSYIDTNSDVDFGVAHPSPWVGKAGARLLFTTKGHRQGAAIHSSPLNQRNRTVAVTNFHI